MKRFDIAQARNGGVMVESPEDGDYVLHDEAAAAITALEAEVARLQAVVKQQRKDAAEEQREFQREAREIAAEARWQERNEQDGVPYGSY